VGGKEFNSQQLNRSILKIFGRVKDGSHQGTEEGGDGLKEEGGRERKGWGGRGKRPNPTPVKNLQCDYYTRTGATWAPSHLGGNGGGG